ncbi:ATP-binding protein [Sphingomonas sp. OTU376]|uniref:ATP-binding protein n=1 Tax=Sphingomonas sp. OTU376 TaxID=3043863 RepID=UPI00313E0BF4
MIDLPSKLVPEPTRHDEFLLALRDRLRNEADTEVILAETAERLGRHLGVNRAGYGEFDEDCKLFIPRSHWIDGAVVSMEAPVPFALFGRGLTASHMRGETWIHESLEDAHVDDEARAIFHELGIVAAITIPLIKDGRLVSLLSVQQNSPRRWPDADVALVAELAERTWATLERARAEEARRQTEELLSAILRHAPIGIYVKDRAGRYELVNEEMARLMKHPVDQITGRTAQDLVDPEAAAKIAEADAAAFEARTPTVLEQNRPGQDRFEYSLSMRLPLEGKTGSGPQLAGFEVDISALKRTEAELERSREALYQSEKITALGSLLAGVSHELNNPLSIIVAQSELLQLEAMGSPAAERAGKIRRAAERSARIVQTFLAMARQKRPNRSRVDLNQVVSAALELNSYGLRANGITVRQDLATDLPQLVADPDQLHQVFTNLIVNAQQAMQEVAGGRQLTLASHKGERGETICVDVTDTGLGVPEDIRRRIFEPFFTTKAQDIGTGVGLSFSQGIVEAHHGRLELLEGVPGTTFRVTLPIGNADSVGIAGEESAATLVQADRQRSALVVDDEVGIAEALADLLAHDGYACRTVNSGDAAKMALRTGRFDLVVSDLRMPDIDGPALFNWLLRARPELIGTVAFSTGDTLSPTAAKFLRESGRPYMEKPFTLAAVRRLVAAVEDRQGKSR